MQLSPPEPSAATRGVSAGAQLAWPSLNPYRNYLRGMDIPPPGVGAYGIVTFHGRPTSATKDRLMMACSAFISYFPRIEAAPPSLAKSDVMLTIWPLDQPTARQAQDDECDFLLAHYDVSAADSAIMDAGKQGANFDGIGPFLVGWSPSTARGAPDKLVLVVDMSGLSSQESFDHAFLAWKQEIIDNPARWRPGRSLQSYRDELRDAIDKYGKSILDSFKVVMK